MLRELAVAFYGSELVYLLGLAFLLAGTAAGTLAGRAWPARDGHPPARLFLVFAALLPATVALARALHRLLGGTPGALFGWASLAGVSAPGEVVAPLYAADLAGGAFGALAGTLFLLPLAGLPATALLLGVGALALLFLVGGGERRLA